MYKKFDSDSFYERMYRFAVGCQKLTKLLSKTQFNREYSDQLIRASGSIGANYIEALEALSKKDFIHRLKISRKESRESIHWLRLIKDTNEEYKDIMEKSIKLIEEVQQVKKILTSSIITSENGIAIDN